MANPKRSTGLTAKDAKGTKLHRALGGKAAANLHRSVDDARSFANLVSFAVCFLEPDPLMTPINADGAPNPVVGRPHSTSSVVAVQPADSAESTSALIGVICG
jgi:hypothetical protein